MSATDTLIPPPPRPKPVDWPAGELPYEDNDILENNIHYAQMDLLWFTLEDHFNDRNDFFVGGNMFLYYSLDQKMNRDFRGPDLFFVWGVDRNKQRKYYATWEENRKFPDLIMEITSPTTAAIDFTEKRELYSKVFHTPEYVCFDPETLETHVWRLKDGTYVPVQPGTDGRYEIQTLSLRLGIWEGEYKHLKRRWLRYFAPDGQMILNAAEQTKLKLAQAAFQLGQVEGRVANLEEQLERLKSQLAPPTAKSAGPGESSQP